MKDLSQDAYQVYNRGELGASDLQVLSHLYQPILSAKGFSLYFTLYGEGMLLKKLSGSSTHYRLCFMTGLDIDELKYAIHSLEGLGLLNTYVNDNNEYIYELLMPLPARKFYKNELLCQLLLSTIGKNDFEKSKYYFINRRIDHTQYHSVTHNFADVYDIHLNKEKVVTNKEEYASQEAKEPELNYDIDLFYKGLSDYQIPGSAITSEVKKTICHLGTLYNIDPITMRGLVYRVYENNTISIADLKKSCQRYYDYNNHSEDKPSLKQTKDTTIHPTTEKERKLVQLQTLSCYEYLTALNNNKKPTKRDLDLIDDIMTSQQLSSGVMNVIIETVIMMNNGGLPRNHMEYLASLFSRKNVKTVKEAIKEAKAYMKDKKDISGTVTQKIVEANQPDESEEDLEQMKKEIENMLKGGF